MDQYTKRKSQEFMKQKSKEEGVIATGTGLLYKIITQGSGTVSPKPAQTVIVEYRGTVAMNGREFDSSFSRGKPSEFIVAQLIPGWSEALQLMHVGDKWELYIPEELAYKGVGAGDIPPYAAIVFTVELMEITETPEKFQWTHESLESITRPSVDPLEALIRKKTHAQQDQGKHWDTLVIEERLHEIYMEDPHFARHFPGVSDMIKQKPPTEKKEL